MPGGQFRLRLHALRVLAQFLVHPIGHKGAAAPPCGTRLRQARVCARAVALSERASDHLCPQAAALEDFRIKRLRYDPEVDDKDDSGYPCVEDEFASDTSNSSDMWERRDAGGRLLPPGKEHEKTRVVERGDSAPCGAQHDAGGLMVADESVISCVENHRRA